METNIDIINKEKLRQEAIFKLDICPTCGAKLNHYKVESFRDHKYTTGMLCWKKEHTQVITTTHDWRMCCSKDKEHLDMGDDNAYWNDAMDDFDHGF